MSKKDFMRDIPKQNGKGNWTRYPVIFASIKNEAEKEKRLLQIRDYKTTVFDLDELTEPFWCEKTKDRLSTYEYKEKNKKGKLEIKKIKTCCVIFPIPLSTLHRINLIYVMIIESTGMPESAFMSEVTLEIMIKAVEFISAEIHNNIENSESEIFYAFRSLYHKSESRFNIMLSIESIQLYIHLRNDIISKGSEFRKRNAIETKEKLLKLEQEIIEQEKSEGVDFPETTLPLWDFHYVDGYLTHYEYFHQYEPMQKVKVCDICGLLYYGGSERKNQNAICGVHRGAELKALERKQK